MLRWSPPSKEKPTVESKRYFSPTPEDLQALVFDYLCHSSYTTTARALLKDTVVKQPGGNNADGTSMDVDDDPTSISLDPVVEERFRLAELRREIKLQILSGRVDEAITLLNRHFPAVLSQDSAEHSSTPSSSNLSSESNNTSTYVSPRSVDPTHLLLDLHILGFIEKARTVPLLYYPPGSSLPSPSPRHSPLPATPNSNHVKEDSEPSVQQQLLLHKAQKLYSDANCLPKPEDRVLYIQELANVTSLLVYPVPESSPMSQYLSQDRRAEMAQQIEGAILHHTKELAVSKIELGVRYTTVIWNLLHEKEALAPPQARWPPGVKLPLSQQETRNASDSAASDERPSGGKKTMEKDNETQQIPNFDLTEFLDAKPR